MVDFLKAFDKVPHQRLLQKLEFSIAGSILTWLTEYCSQQMALSGALSSPCKVNSGVHQGSVLGLTLFLAYTLMTLQMVCKANYTFICRQQHNIEQ